MINTNEKKLEFKQNIYFIRILIYAAIVGLGAGVIGTLFTVSVNSCHSAKSTIPMANLFSTTRWRHYRSAISTSKI